jgi:hypothetical protein
MSGFFSWQSPSGRLVVDAVLDTLAEIGYDQLTGLEVKTRAGAAGPALGDSPDLDFLVIAALEHVVLFRAPEPTGQLRQDLRTLLEPWRTAPGRDERAVAAVLGPAMVRPPLRVAVHEALDRPLTHHIAAMVARSAAREQIPTPIVQTLCWVLRGLLVDRLRSGPRPQVDIDLLVDYLIAGLERRPAEGPRPWPAIQPATEPTKASA